MVRGLFFYLSANLSARPFKSAAAPTVFVTAWNIVLFPSITAPAFCTTLFPAVSAGGFQSPIILHALFHIAKSVQEPYATLYANDGPQPSFLT